MIHSEGYYEKADYDYDNHLDRKWDEAENNKE
jgi:hypothetical protein